MRTHECGQVRADQIGATVVVCGWVGARRDHGGVVFIDLRDSSGIVQVVIDPEAAGGEVAHALRAEYVLAVTGSVRARPDGTVNPDLATGEIEVEATEVEVLAESEPPPFPIDERAADTDEVIRLQHRYLDLRRPAMQDNLRRRGVMNAALRQSMTSQGFTEIETPMLVASTPEGARDFVVPSRLNPGNFYALPQSPQLFKQLLMVGGLDRYFQIARCLRDEDLRAGRQFEFMQYDMEMSFADEGDVQAVVAEAVGAAVTAVTGEAAPAFGRMTWQEAADRYGSDKPDVRFDLELVDLRAVFASTGFRAFQAESVRGVRVPGRADIPRKQRDALIDRAKALGAAGLVSFKLEGGALAGPGLNHLSTDEQAGLIAALGAVDGDLILIVAGAPAMTCAVLGALRLELGRPPLHEGGLQFLWVTEFPLFEGLDAEGRPIPAHHPFTMPHPDDLELLATASGEDLLAVRSRAFDLVLNGWELGSGSVRIHRPELQRQIFSVLGISEEAAAARFGFLLEALRYGAPPHAGFAVGTDRLAALLCGEENIREVIAFPKTQSGADPLTGAPTEIDPTHLRDLGLQPLRPT